MPVITGCTCTLGMSHTILCMQLCNAKTTVERFVGQLCEPSPYKTILKVT